MKNPIDKEKTKEVLTVDRNTVFNFLFFENEESIDTGFFDLIANLEEKSIEEKYTDFSIDLDKLKSFLITVSSESYNTFSQILRDAVYSLSEDEISVFDEDTIEDKAFEILSEVLSDFEQRYKAIIAENYSKKELIEKGILKKQIK